MKSVFNTVRKDTTPRERALRALRFKSADIVPWQVEFTQGARRRMADFLGDPGFESRIGNHLAKLSQRPAEKKSVSAKSLDCVVCGNLVADTLAQPIANLGTAQHKLHQSLDRIVLSPGGFGCNVAMDLARLGVRTGLIGRVGEDEWKNMMIRALEATGVDLTGVITDPVNQSSASIVCVDASGERSFCHAVGAHRNLCAKDLLERMDYIGRAKVFAFGYYGMVPSLDRKLQRVFRTAREQAGVAVLLDTCAAVGDTLSDLSLTLPHVDYFIPSYEEAVTLTGSKNVNDMVKIFRDCGAPAIVGLKLGGKGCLLDDGNRRVRVKALPVPRVVDTTGAGDAFLAGIITAHLRGLDLEMMARFANAVGSCCVQAFGATLGIRPFEETWKLLGKNEDC